MSKAKMHDLSVSMHCVLIIVCMAVVITFTVTFCSLFLVWIGMELHFALNQSPCHPLLKLRVQKTVEPLTRSLRNSSISMRCLLKWEVTQEKR